MKIELNFQVTKEDYLRFLMYSSGESSLQRGRRKRNRIIVTILLGAISAIGFSSGIIALGGTFSALTVLAYILHPRFTKWWYEKRYSKFINKTYREKIGKEAIFRLEEDGIYESGAGTEGKIEFSAVRSIVELENHFLIRLKQSASIILPKERLNKKILRRFIQEVSRRTGLPITDHTARRWS
ncbi:MAG: YcxB family protein [Dehalococcoidia bacterium]|nr:YcxB family protein [Dehalococcoidia bacterium]